LNVRQCPFCAEEIQDEARVCKHCGRELYFEEAGRDRIVWEDRPSYRSYAVRLSLASLLVFVGALGLGDSEASSWALLGALGVFVWLHALWRRNARRYRITDRAVIFERGIVSRSVCELRLSEVSRIELEQGFLERLMGVGSLYLNTGDQRRVEVEFEGIREPERVRGLVADHAMRRRS
jgi:membrane protein YdbS with pleckstrin-like domain